MYYLRWNDLFKYIYYQDVCIAHFYRHTSSAKVKNTYSYPFLSMMLPVHLMT